MNSRTLDIKINKLEKDAAFYKFTMIFSGTTGFSELAYCLNKYDPDIAFAGCATLFSYFATNIVYNKIKDYQFKLRIKRVKNNLSDTKTDYRLRRN
jgi:hypothetical protein